MITKTGSEMVKEGFVGSAVPIIGAVIGAGRAGGLSPEQEEAIRQYNGINSGSLGLKLRNAGRGVFGGMLGAMAGSTLGALTMNPRMMQAAGILGGALGSWKATNKYSRGRANELRDFADRLQYSKYKKEIRAVLPEVSS